ncbi:MAG: protein kinase, partial [Pseudomonadota bacterium]
MVDPQLDIAAMALLERALEQPTGRSREWLQSQTDVGPEIKQRALDLLAAMPSASARLSTGAAAQYGEDIAPPERIGAYKVVEMLGQGGMGAVFKAERDAGDFEHLVAIKLVRPGILSPRLVERFERERQILAGLSHPGIARLYDGGKTPEGGPYIVMEFIDGVPIDRWAQEQQLELAARLQLIRKVCDA